MYYPNTYQKGVFLMSSLNSPSSNVLSAKSTIFLLLITIAPHSMAGGFSEGAIPTRIDIDRERGLMVYGNFGNPAGCTISDRVYINYTHPQYQQIYSAVLAAYASGKRIQVYAHTCKPVGWYSVDSVTYNHVESYGTVSLFN